MVQIAPSILSADFANLGRDIKMVSDAGADLIHIDVMDGHFVPNLTFGPIVIRAVRSYTDKPFDVHLMMTNPADYIEVFAKSGADMITVHLECDQDISTLISMIKKHGKKVGISVKPNTKVADIIPYIPDIDLVLVMSVEPGFGGQAFMPEALKKIAELKHLIGRKKVKISVDGGINDVTAGACRLAGADILVAGSYIFESKSYADAMNKLRKG